MVVTGIFHLLEEEDLIAPPAPAKFYKRSERKLYSVKPSRDRIFEEKISENETLVAVRAGDLCQAMLLSDLLSQAGARYVEIDAEAA